MKHTNHNKGLKLIVRAIIFLYYSVVKKINVLTKVNVINRWLRLPLEAM